MSFYEAMNDKPKFATNVPPFKFTISSVFLLNLPNTFARGTFEIFKFINLINIILVSQPFIYFYNSKLYIFH